MKKTGVLTIVVLILIIIALALALVVTNLPKNKENVPQNNEEQVENVVDKKEEETPSYLDLNSDKVKDMYSMLNYGGQLFHYVKLGVKTIDDFADEDIQSVAYYYDAYKHVQAIKSTMQMEDGTLEARFMDEAVAKVFGPNVKYNKTFAYWSTKNTNFLRYSEDDGLYHRFSGMGGGGNVYYATAITEVREYSDRYEVVEKGVAVKTAYEKEYVYPYFATEMPVDPELGSFDSYDSLGEAKSMYSSRENDAKVITKFEDGATEYKHVFMKNSDGTYYWVSTEIVK